MEDKVKLKEQILAKIKEKQGIDRQPDCQLIDPDLGIYLYKGIGLPTYSCTFGDLVDDKPCFMITACDSMDVVYRLVFFPIAGSRHLYYLQKPDIVICTGELS